MDGREVLLSAIFALKGALKASRELTDYVEDNINQVTASLANLRVAMARELEPSGLAPDEANWSVVPDEDIGSRLENIAQLQNDTDEFIKLNLTLADDLKLAKALQEELEKIWFAYRKTFINKLTQ